jgi:hypothetical protein
MGIIMRFIKLIGFSVVILFALVTGLGLLFPSQVLVSRAVDITAPKDSILLLVKDVNGWKKWVEGMNDQSVVISSPSKALLGKTDVTITKVSDSSITSIWVGRNGNQQIGSINLFGDSTRIQTVVQWEFQQQLKWYPWERFASMMNDKILGTMMEKNLNNLKALVESK